MLVLFRIHAAEEDEECQKQYTKDMNAVLVEEEQFAHKDITDKEDQMPNSLKNVIPHGFKAKHKQMTEVSDGKVNSSMNALGRVMNSRLEGKGCGNTCAHA